MTSNLCMLLGQQGGGGLWTLMPFLGAIVVFMFVMSAFQRKDRKKFEDMLNNLKRNDRVQTVGGVIGTVVDVRDNEVILKVDESSNVKVRFVKGAIKQKLEPEPAKK